jgi:putative NADH-flavin reductase
VAVSRSQVQDPVPGVRYETGPAEDVAGRVVPGADAVVAALSPRGETAGRLVDIYGTLVHEASDAGARYLQVGGFSSLRPAPDAPRFVEGEIAAEYRDEALEGEATRVLLADHAPEDLDWVFVSPAAEYGAWVPGERTGGQRVSDEVAILDEQGHSFVSGADFAAAIVDEIEDPKHHRAHIGVVG